MMRSHATDTSDGVESERWYDALGHKEYDQRATQVFNSGYQHWAPARTARQAQVRSRGREHGAAKPTHCDQVLVAGYGEYQEPALKITIDTSPSRRGGNVTNICIDSLGRPKRDGKKAVTRQCMEAAAQQKSVKQEAEAGNINANASSDQYAKLAEILSSQNADTKNFVHQDETLNQQLHEMRKYKADQDKAKQQQDKVIQELRIDVSALHTEKKDLCQQLKAMTVISEQDLQQLRSDIMAELRSELQQHRANVEQKLQEEQIRDQEQHRQLIAAELQARTKETEAHNQSLISAFQKLQQDVNDQEQHDAQELMSNCVAQCNQQLDTRQNELYRKLAAELASSIKEVEENAAVQSSRREQNVQNALKDFGKNKLKQLEDDIQTQTHNNQTAFLCEVQAEVNTHTKATEIAVSKMYKFVDNKVALTCGHALQEALARATEYFDRIVTENRAAHARCTQAVEVILSSARGQLKSLQHCEE